MRTPLEEIFFTRSVSSIHSVPLTISALLEAGAEGHILDAICVRSDWRSKRRLIRYAMLFKGHREVVDSSLIKLIGICAKSTQERRNALAMLEHSSDIRNGRE